MADSLEPARLKRALTSLEASLIALEREIAEVKLGLREARHCCDRLVELYILESGERSPAAGVAALTLQERRVALLVVAGKTNHEVAATLHVSDETVKSQMKRILQKLELRSRWQLREAFLLGGPQTSPDVTVAH